MIKKCVKALMLIVAFVGIGFIIGSKSVCTMEDFVAIAESNGCDVFYSSRNDIHNGCTVYPPTRCSYIVFYEYSTVGDAIQAYYDKYNELDDYATTINSRILTSESLRNYQCYTISNGHVYQRLERIDNSYIYVYADADEDIEYVKKLLHKAIRYSCFV